MLLTFFLKWDLRYTLLRFFIKINEQNIQNYSTMQSYSLYNFLPFLCFSIVGVMDVTIGLRYFSSNMFLTDTYNIIKLR